MSKILLHIGYPKAGSTFLGDWFQRHPDIIFNGFAIGGISDTRELINLSAHNLIDDNKIFTVRDMRFSAPVSTDFKNIDNIEVFQQRIAKSLCSLFPDAKVLIVTRGFESAIKATYSQYLKEGGILRFSEFIERGRNSSWLPYNYSFVIDLYCNLFGSENVLVIPFEMLKISHVQFLSKIETFLELKPFSFQPEVKNQSLSPQNMAFIRKWNKIMHIISFVFGPLHFWFFRQYVKMLDKRKTESWNNSSFVLFSKFFKPVDFNCFTAEELAEKFSIHAKILKDNPEYQNFKKEYLIDSGQHAL